MEEGVEDVEKRVVELHLVDLHVELEVVSVDEVLKIGWGKLIRYEPGSSAGGFRT